MSANYWNLLTTLTCLGCGVRFRWRLSTHFMGDTWSCLNTYTRNEAIPELLGVSVLLDGRIDAFRGECPHCETLDEIGARISKGRVTKVWPLGVIEKVAIRSGDATKR